MHFGPFQSCTVDRPKAFGCPPIDTAATLLAARMERREGLKALTVQQPYAELLLGPKWVENRTWATRHHGLLAIHAGGGTRWLRHAPVEHLVAAERTSLMRPRELCRGAIIGLGYLRTCIELSARPDSERWIDRHEYAGGPYCWVFAWTVRLSRPIPCRGALSLWNVSTEQASQILTQLRRASNAATNLEGRPRRSSGTPK